MKMSNAQKVVRDKIKFRIALTRLGFKTYQEYLKSDHWKDIKSRWVVSGRLCECAVCAEKKYELHHKSYKRLGKETLGSLMPLCRTHHKLVHQISGELELRLKKSDQIAAVIKGVDPTILRRAIYRHAVSRW